MRKFIRGMMVLSVGVLLTGCGCNDENIDNVEMIETNKTLNDYSNDLVAMAQECEQSVVVVEAGAQLGSGVVYKEEGNYAYILTNAHVLTDTRGSTYYEDIDITFSNHAKVRGMYIFLDRNEDVAVISVPKSDNYKIAKIIDNDSKVEEQEIVFSIGHPHGYKFTHTVGSISKTRIKTSTDYISGTSNTKTYVYNHSATINKGNSGGPLFNSKGEVIAINSMQPTSSELRDFNYAIPINYFIKVANYIVTTRTAYVKPTLNLEVKSIEDYKTSDLQAMGILVKEGVYIAVSNEPEVAKGRIITHINGQKISTFEDYEFELLKYSKNETITLTTTDVVGSQERATNIKVK